MSKDVEKFLDKYSPEVREIALKARAVILGLGSDANEKVYPGWRIIAYSYGSGMKGQFCAIGPVKGYVNIYFMRGTDLPDPSGLLDDTGKKMRHVKIRTPKDAQGRALKSLIKAVVTMARSHT